MLIFRPKTTCMLIFRMLFLQTINTIVIFSHVYLCENKDWKRPMLIFQKKQDCCLVSEILISRKNQDAS